MDIPSLTAFLTVAECNSFSVAAEKLHLTQPAVSKRVASLESQLDTQLFDRIGRKIHLSEAGRVLLPRARQILAVMKDAQQQINNLQTQVKGSLSMATSHHIGLRKLPAVLKSYARLYPDVRLDIHFVDSEAAYKMINNGEIELGVITLSPEQPDRIRHHLLWDDPLVFMVSRDHPLAEVTEASIQHLSEHQAILPGSSTFTYRRVMSLFKEEGLSLQTAMSSNYLETIRMLVAIGLAWSILPESMLGDDLVKLNTTCKTTHRSLGHITHEDRTLSNAARAFLALLEGY